MLKNNYFLNIQLLKKNVFLLENEGLSRIKKIDLFFMEKKFRITFLRCFAKRIKRCFTHSYSSQLFYYHTTKHENY